MLKWTLSIMHHATRVDFDKSHIAAYLTTRTMIPLTQLFWQFNLIRDDVSAKTKRTDLNRAQHLFPNTKIIGRG